jgi:hypothetical protein
MSLRDRFKKERNRGTSSLTLAIPALEEGPGDEARGPHAPGSGEDGPPHPPLGRHAPPASTSAATERLIELKARIHRRMVERINLAMLEDIDSENLRAQVRQIISGLVGEEQLPLSEAERTSLEEQIINETFGLGPIEPLLHDPDVADILVNGHDSVYIERFGLIEPTDIKFDDDEHLMKGGPSRGRVLSDGRRPTRRRLARQCDHSAARARRPLAVHSSLRRPHAPSRRPGPDRISIRRHGRDLQGRGSLAPEHADRRRHRLR